MHTFLHPIQGSKCVILVVIFSHGRHAILSVRLSRGLSSVTEDKPCFPSDYPGGYLQSLKTCHVILQIILGVMFSHREHDMLSVRLSWGLSSVTEDMPCYPSDYPGGLSSVTEDMPSCPSDYPGGYLQSLRTCHAILYILLGMIFCHWWRTSSHQNLQAYCLHKNFFFICYWWYTILAFRSCNRQSFVSHEVFVVFRILQR